MPIYEYQCKDCGEKFEKLVFSSHPETVYCPNCRSDKTEKKISAFASTNAGDSHGTGNSSSGGCGFSGFS